MHTFILKPKKVPKPEPSILAPPRASPCSADRSAGRGFGIWDFWQVESTERPPPSPRLRMYITGLGISSFAAFWAVASGLKRLGCRPWVGFRSQGLRFAKVSVLGLRASEEQGLGLWTQRG